MGEYSRTYKEARESLFNIITDLGTPGSTDRTISIHDASQFFEIFCSGCGLMRDPDDNGIDDHFRRKNSYSGVSVHGWFGSYGCRLCPSRFSRLHLLESHQQGYHTDAINQHHPPSQFQCPDCEALYEKGAGLEEHWRRKHYAGPERDGDISSCDICGTEHGDSHGLSTHRSSPAHKNRAYLATHQQGV